MVKSREKIVLFLAGKDYSSSRVAEGLFNTVAEKMGLPVRARSRSLRQAPGGETNAPLAKSSLQTLKASGVNLDATAATLPADLTRKDLEESAWIVGLHQAEQAPLLQEQFADFFSKVIFWSVSDREDSLAQMEPQIMRLIARILGGDQQEDASPSEPAASPRVEKEPRPKPVLLKVGRETAGRRGKGVTTVFDIPLDERSVTELAALLKQRCGTGGTVKNGRIEIQGDQRERIIAELEKLGYKVKRVGG